MVRLMVGRLAILLAAVTVIASSASAGDAMLIEIARTAATDECLRGELRVDGEPVCVTLELPWKENEKKVSAIPAGTYKGFLRYDKSDRWRIQLENVPGRSGVQIHVGNYPRDTQGCVLVGTGYDGCAVAESQKAYAKLKKSFYGTDTPNATPNKAIEVRIYDPPS